MSTYKVGVRHDSKVLWPGLVYIASQFMIHVHTVRTLPEDLREGMVSTSRRLGRLMQD